MEPYPKIDTVFKRDPATKHKTLIEGAYSRPEFAYLANNEWEFTEKVDGTNIRVIYTHEPAESCGQVRFAGKTDAAQLYPPLLAYLERTFTVQRMADVFEDATLTEPCEVCLYGEGYGARIQKGGGNYRSDVAFVLFDVRVGRWWLRRMPVVEIATKLGVEVVPTVDFGTLSDMVELVRLGFPSRWGDFTAEGVVARPRTELWDRGGRRIITKLKYRDFR